MAQFKKLRELGYRRCIKPDKSDIVLGEGGFGRVLLGQKEFDLSNFVAIKIMDMDRKKKGTERTPAEKEKYKEAVGKEIRTHATLSQLNHPNIVKQLAHFMIDNKIFIILEYCNNETVQQYATAMWSKRNSMAENQIRHWFKQMVQGLEAMHSANIIPF